jgi:hypothetical protein
MLNSKIILFPIMQPGKMQKCRKLPKNPLKNWNDGISRARHFLRKPCQKKYFAKHA